MSLSLNGTPNVNKVDTKRSTRRWLLSRIESRENAAAYAFLLPWFIGFFGLTIGPVIASLLLSFTNYNLLTPPHWAGITNYQSMIHDADFWHSLRLTFIFVFISVPLHLVFALLLALLLNQKVRFIGVFRTVYYLPSLMGGSVAVAMVWKQVFGPSGIFDRFLSLFGIHTSMDWVADPRTILGSIILLQLWQFGSSMLIFLAGLKQIPAELYEAAVVDGCTSWTRFWKITLPLLTPTIFFNLVMGIISSFQTFTPAYVIGDGQGGPMSSTLFYTLYLYLQGFSFFHMGYAAALAWVMLLIVAMFTAILFISQRYWVFYMDGREFGGGR